MRLRRNKYRDTDYWADDAPSHRRQDYHLQMDLEAAMKLETEFCVRQFMDPETKTLTAAFAKTQAT